MEIILATERGVKFVRGKKVVEVGPGLRWYWPAMTELKTAHVNRQAIGLDTLTLTTKDQQAVIAGGIVVYTIDDIQKYLVDNYDADDAIEDVAAAALRDAVVEHSFDELCATRREIDKILTANCRKALRPFGARVEYARMRDFARARIINVVGGATATPLPEEDE